MARFCAPKRVGYSQTFFVPQSSARDFPVSFRGSLSPSSQCKRRSYNVAPKCVQVREKIVQRSSADVCKCKRRSYNGAAQVCAGARKDRTT